MKVLITGATGQVARGLVQLAPHTHTIATCDRSQLDMTNSDSIAAAIRAAAPDVVINAAAYTAVDRAETDRDAAYAVNAIGVGYLAGLCAAKRIKLVHISTDYVFDGRSSNAYAPDAATDPINVYGASKLAGEKAIASVVDLHSITIRTAWVYSPWGKNFVLTMLGLMRERESVSVVNDQIGTPTSALNLARFIWSAIAVPNVRGMLHYTDSGTASWYDFAAAIQEEGLERKLLTRVAHLKAIPTSQYPTPAKRPAFSLLSTTSSLALANFKPVHWRDALVEVMETLKS